MLAVADLTTQLLTLVVGFTLTTVAGGLLGSWLQTRSWEHQHALQARSWEHQHARALAESDRAQATATFRELSQLMDKRLYRMEMVRVALFGEEVDLERIERRMDDYRAVLFEWNDVLIRNIATTEMEFGTEVRTAFEYSVCEHFKEVGRTLERRYLVLRDGASQDGEGRAEIGQKLAQLRASVYRLNIDMLQQIRDEQVGRRASAQSSAGSAG